MQRNTKNEICHSGLVWCDNRPSTAVECQVKFMWYMVKMVKNEWFDRQIGQKGVVLWYSTDILQI